MNGRSRESLEASPVESGGVPGAEPPERVARGPEAWGRRVLFATAVARPPEAVDDRPKYGDSHNLPSEYFIG
jgi:hypothetical protein